MCSREILVHGFWIVHFPLFLCICKIRNTCVFFIIISKKLPRSQLNAFLIMDTQLFTKWTIVLNVPSKCNSYLYFWISWPFLILSFYCFCFRVLQTILDQRYRKDSMEFYGYSSLEFYMHFNDSRYMDVNYFEFAFQPKRTSIH